MPGVRVSPLGPNNDNLNYIVQAGNVIGFIISIEMFFKTYKGREGPVLVCFIPHANILLTGAGFGIEASLIAIIGYTLACLTLAFIYRRNHVGILEG